MKLPIPEARELPDDEAWKALFDDFRVLDDEPTQPAPLLQLEPLPDDPFLAQVRRAFGRIE